jgi:hypothetical protein
MVAQMTDQIAVQASLTRVNAPIFLAREHRGQIWIHTTAKGPLRRLRAQADAALQAEGVTTPCRIVRNSARALYRPWSLEGLCDRFAGGRVLYDPTQYFTRAESLVALSRLLRAALGDDVRALSIDSQRRILFVTVQPPKDLTAAHVNGRNVELVRAAHRVVQTWQASAPQGFNLTVRISEETPVGAALVPIDRQSVWTSLKAAFLSRKISLRKASALGMAIVMGGAMAVPAGADPAVSKTNFGFIARGGSIGGEEKFDAGGKVTFPFAENFGAQLELGAGNDEYFGAGLQLFWRNPNDGLIGVFASHENELGLELDRFGAMGEVYIDRITLSTKVGLQSGDVASDIFGSLEVAYYASDALKLRLLGDFTPEVSTVTAGIEWRPALEVAPNLSVFADLSQSDRDQSSVMVGMTLHFGDSTSLMDRDRKEDPYYVIFRRQQLQQLADDIKAAGALGYGLPGSGPVPLD